MSFDVSMVVVVIAQVLGAASATAARTTSARAGTRDSSPIGKRSPGTW
ncbi:hypothetical protein [Streptomyces sp. SAJ15]|nr:hypothetical protein [Streptomyces sp. SAJ15]